jgi:hypothetical protein
MAARPWTRLGTAGAGAHVLYELVCGVAVPFASRIGVWPATALYAVGSVVAIREAGRQPPERDRGFSVLCGFYLSAVLAHLAGWPRTSRAGLPWLTECEGIDGRPIAAYNVILYVSAVGAVGGLAENRGVAWGAAVPPVVVPLLVAVQHQEVARLQQQARARPRWWNRRLQSS